MYILEIFGFPECKYLFVFFSPINFPSICFSTLICWQRHCNEKNTYLSIVQTIGQECQHYSIEIVPRIKIFLRGFESVKLCRCVNAVFGFYVAIAQTIRKTIKSSITRYGKNSIFYFWKNFFFFFLFFCSKFAIAKINRNRRIIKKFTMVFFSACENFL